MALVADSLRWMARWRVRRRARQHPHRQRSSTRPLSPSRLHRPQRPTSRLRTADRVTRRRGLLSLFGLLCASLVVLVPAPVRAAEDDSLQLISQNFNIPADGSLTATIALPADLADDDMSTALIAVTVEQRVNRREDLGTIIDRKLQRRDDTVAISPICCLSLEPGQYSFSIPLEVAEVRPDALSIPRTGLYPVTIAVQHDGRILATLLTFINRLPATDETPIDPDPVSVALAIGTHGAVHLDSKGTTSLDDKSTIAEMTALADTLDALAPSNFPATVRIAPEVLNGLQVLDPALFARLIKSLQQHQVIAETQWPIDSSAAAAAGQNSLYTSWLRDGQDRLVGLGARPGHHQPVDDLRRSTDQCGRCFVAPRPRGGADGHDPTDLRRARARRGNRSVQRLHRRALRGDVAERHFVRGRRRRPHDLRLAGASSAHAGAHQNLCARQPAGAASEA